MPDAEDLTLAQIADVTTLLGRTINDVRQGKVDVKVANAVGYLAGVLLKSLEGGDVEQRLAALEEAMAKKGNRNSRVPYQTPGVG